MGNLSVKFCNHNNNRFEILSLADYSKNSCLENDEHFHHKLNLSVAIIKQMIYLSIVPSNNSRLELPVVFAHSDQS